MNVKKLRNNILYSLQPADTKPTFEGLTCTSRRYTFLYLALMLLFVNQFHWTLDTFFSDTRIQDIQPMYKIFAITVLAFGLTCGLYILNLDNIQDKLTMSLKRLLKKIRTLDPKAPWDKIIMQDMHCDDELQDIVDALNIKSSQIQNHIDYLEKLIWFIQHEFNTPLAITHLHLERLRKKWLGKEKEFLGVEEELSHMKSLVEALVWLIRTKTESFEVESVSLSQVIAQVSKKLKTLHKEANFNIHIEKDVHINSNKQYIWAICRNICENALKHGSDAVEISLDENHLIIQDNWIWMDTDTIEKIWLPFWKKTPRAWQKEWFWLWLSLVKVLLDKLQRKVDIQNWEAWWTKFIFTHST